MSIYKLAQRDVKDGFYFVIHSPPQYIYFYLSLAGSIYQRVSKIRLCTKKDITCCVLYIQNILSVCLCVCLSVSICLSLSLSPSVCLSICLLSLCIPLSSQTLPLIDSLTTNVCRTTPVVSRFYALFKAGAQNEKRKKTILHARDISMETEQFNSALLKIDCRLIAQRNQVATQTSSKIVVPVGRRFYVLYCIYYYVPGCLAADPRPLCNRANRFSN